jgi:hypothetical protein
MVTLSVSERFRLCSVNLQQVISLLSQPNRTDDRVKHTQVKEEFERFIVFVRNIGALHGLRSSLSIESQLQGVNEVITHLSTLLDDLTEASTELLDIVSGKKGDLVWKEIIGGAHAATLIGMWWKSK